MKKLQETVGLAVWVVITFSAAGIGSVFTRKTVENWYVGISKPEWTPPNWVFGPVWTTLYLMMAFAAWLVWRNRRLSDVRTTLSIFALQLMLNAFWSVAFFGLKNIGLALIDIVFLWLAIGATITLFLKVNRLAGWLLIPYLLWVTFAGILNLKIWTMNR